MSGRGVVIPDRPRPGAEDDVFIASRRRSRGTPPPPVGSAPPAAADERGIALYSRYSSEREWGDNSETRQFRNAELQAARLPGRIVAKYSDRGVSGATLARSGVAQLLRDAVAGLFKVVIVESISRLGRDLGDLLFIFDKLEEMGVEIWTSDDQLVDRTRLEVEGILAHLERAEKASETRRGRHAAFYRGVLAQRIPFGFATDRRYPGHRFPHPERAPAVAEAYRRVIDGDPPSSVARWLTGRLPTPGECSVGAGEPRGARWTTQMVRNLIENPMNAGLLSDGKTKQLTDPDTLKVLAVQTTNPSSWDVAAIVSRAIVDTGTWLKAVAALPRTKLTKAAPRHRQMPLLSEVASCGLCRSRAVLKRGSGQTVWFSCSDVECQGLGTPSRAAVETAALRALLDQLESEPPQPATLDLAAVVRRTMARVPFITRSDEDRRAAEFVRTMLEDVRIAPVRPDGSQCIEVVVPARTGPERMTQAGSWVVREVEVPEPDEERSQAQKVAPRAPLSAAERLRLLPEDAWAAVEGLAKRQGLSFRQTGWKERALLEMLLLFCLTDRRPYDVPSNLGPFYSFPKAARRSIRSGFWDEAVSTLKRSHPLVVAGARLERADLLRQAEGVSDGTSLDARHWAATATRESLRARLEAAAAVMDGERADLAAQRLRMGERPLAAWVICVRENCVDGLLDEEEAEADAAALSRAIAAVDQWAEQSSDPEHLARLGAVKGFLSSKPRREITGQAGVGWTTVRRWLKSLMVAGKDDLCVAKQRSILLPREIEELRAVVLGRVDPDNPGEPVSGLVLKRICRQRFGRDLGETTIQWLVIRGWAELESGELDFHSGVRSKVLTQVIKLVRDDMSS